MTAKFSQLWLLFGMSSLITWIAYRTLWMTDQYWLILTILSFCSISAAIVVAIESKFQLRSLALLLLGLLIGQWWWVQKFLMQAYWSLNGFAP